MKLEAHLSASSKILRKNILMAMNKINTEKNQSNSYLNTENSLTGRGGKKDADKNENLTTRSRYGQSTVRKGGFDFLNASLAGNKDGGKLLSEKLFPNLNVKIIKKGSKVVNHYKINPNL